MKSLDKGQRIPFGWDVLFNSMFMLYCIICTAPLLLVLSISLSQERAVLDHGYSFIPKVFSAEAYKFIFTGNSMVLRAYIVTIAITLIGTVISVLIVSMYGYAASRSDVKYRNVFVFILFFTMLFGGGLVPSYIINVRLLHLKNNPMVLILPQLMSGYLVIVIRTYFKNNLLDSILESARIDGAGELRTFFQIVFPLSLPGLASIGLFASFAYWNEWFIPLLYITDTKYYTLQFLLQNMMSNLQFIRDNAVKLGALAATYEVPSETARMATCIMAIGPIVLAYPFFQKYFVKGLTLGAIKG